MSVVQHLRQSKGAPADLADLIARACHALYLPRSLKHMTAYRISGHCNSHYCGASRVLDLDALIEWLGPDYVVINETRISRNFLCQSPACEHAQKGIRGGGLTLQPRT